MGSKAYTGVSQVCPHPNPQGPRMCCIMWQRDLADVIKVTKVKIGRLGYLGGSSLITQMLKAQIFLQVEAESCGIRESQRDSKPEKDSIVHCCHRMWRGAGISVLEPQKPDFSQLPDWVHSSPHPRQLVADVGLWRS